MLKNVRINEIEAQKIYTWLSENNPKLKENCGTELIGSEVIHLLIHLGLERLKVRKYGNVEFE